MNRQIKVLLAKLGLDVHNRGIIIVAKELSNAGMEIIYIGNALPKQILNTAIQEDVDVVGVSCLCGSHLSLGRPLIEAAQKDGLDKKMSFVIGGVFGPKDAEELRKVGYDGVFTPGATSEQIVSSVKQMVAAKM